MRPLLMAILAFAMTSPVFAQTSPEGEALKQGSEGGEAQVLPEQQGDQLLVGEQLLGLQVVSPQGDSLGRVQDLVLDSDGKLAGIVLSSGGFLGFGAKPVGITWSDVTAAMNADVLTLDLTPEQVAKAPEFKTKTEQEAEQMERETRQQQQQQGGSALE